MVIIIQYDYHIDGMSPVPRYWCFLLLELMRLSGLRIDTGIISEQSQIIAANIPSKILKREDSLSLFSYPVLSVIKLQQYLLINNILRNCRNLQNLLSLIPSYTSPSILARHCFDRFKFPCWKHAKLISTSIIEIELNTYLRNHTSFTHYFR